MSTASKSFTALGAGLELQVRDGESFTYAVSGTFVGTVALQQQVGKGGWDTLVTTAVAASGTLVADAKGKAFARFRFACLFFTSGTIVTAIADVTSEATVVLRDAAGVPVLNITEAGPSVPTGKVFTAASAELTSPKVTTPLGSVYALEATFTETAGAGVYTAPFSIPAGATLIDIIVNGVALWNPATSAVLKVGDTDDDGYYTAVDLKATDLLAGESISFAQAGGKAGVYIANSQVSPRYSSSARTINAIVTVVGGSGSTGRTRVTVVYHLPVTADIVAATKV